MIINDDLGAFMKVPTAMGNRAARLIDQLFFSRLLSNPAQADGKALFSTNHKNLLSGASSALSSDSLNWIRWMPTVSRSRWNRNICWFRLRSSISRSN